MARGTTAPPALPPKRAPGPLLLSAHRGGPLIVAHRGAWDPAPQNSLESVAGAIERGCDMVELDVRRTADGRLVTIHGPRIRGAAVARLDHESLRRALGGGQPPLLEEVLELAAGRIRADIELKEDGYVEQAIGLIRARLDAGGCVVTSFIDGVLQTVRAVAPEMPTGLIMRIGPPPESRVRRAGVSFLVPHLRLLRAGILEWATERGLPSYVWTVNGDRRLRTLLSDQRVDGVITDRPAEALAIRAALRDHSGSGQNYLDIVDNRE
jgi:glycerophosphoryl diester phosphodiesterase